MKNRTLDPGLIDLKEKYPETLEECLELVRKLKTEQLEWKEKIEEIAAEKELAQNELNRHIRFYNEAPSGYFTLNSEGVILEINQSACKFLGEQADQLKGKLLRDFLHTNSMPVFDDFISNIFKSQIKVSSKVSLKSLHNIPANVLIEGISLPNNTECLIDMVDISGRIKILEQLAESEMRYQQLLESLNDGVGIVDLEENFIYSNPAGDQIFGVSAGELRNRNLKEFLKPDQEKTIQKETEKRVLSEKSRYELEIITPDGTEKTIFVSRSPQYNRDGSVIGTFGLFSDITNKKKTEREIQRRLRLELIISEISNDFVHLKREYLDHSVNRALQKIGNFAEVDRSYVFLFSEDGLFCNNTHEWCETNIEPQIENLKGVPNEMLPWWMEKLHNYETIHVPLVANLPPEAQAEKDILEAQDIKSVLVIPLLTSNSLIGFLGFDSVAQEKTWQNEDILLLTMLGEILGNGFGRMKYEEDLILINSQLELKVEERTMELTRQLKLNRAIVSAVPDMLFKLSEDGTFLEFHNQVNSIPIMPKEAFIGKKIDEVLPVDLAKTSMEMLKNALLSREVSKYEYQLPLNGETSFFENRIIAISDHEALSIIRDITERKKMESELRWNESLLKLMASSSPLAFLVVDNRTDEILYFNPQFCEIWGITHLEERMHRKELKNNDIIPDCLPVLKDVMAFANSCKPLQFVENRVVIEDEIPFIDGRTIRRFSTQIRSENDEYFGRLYIFEDITQRKTAEEFIGTQRDLGISLSAVSDLNEALSLALDSVLQLEGIDCGGIYLLDKKTNVPQLAVHKGLSTQFVNNIELSGTGERQIQLVLAGKPIYESYLQIAPEKKTDQDRDYMLGLAVIPIQYEGKVIGCLNLGSRTFKEIPEITKPFLEALAIQISIAISRIISENALLSSQQNFRMLFDKLDDFMFILDLNGNIMTTNPVVRMRLGYSLEELQQMHVLGVHPPDRREEAGFIVNEMLAGNANYCPVPLMAKDGTLIPVETRVIFGKWDENDVLYGISRDITERQKAEAALKMQSAAFESFDLPIIITDIRGKIQWANSSYFRLTGYSKAETLGKTEGELSNSGIQSKAFYMQLWNTILKGEVWSGELVNRRKDGSLYPQELTITPVFNHKNEISSFIAIKIDITERKAIEAELRSSEERWQFALEGSGDGVWDWNIQTNQMYFSTQWKSMLGYTDSEIENKYDEWEKRIFPEDLALCISDMNKHLNDETEIYVNEHRMLCKNGSYKWILDRGKVVDRTRDGKAMRIIGTHTDITTRKLLEEQLKKGMEKEKELNDLKSRFVSTASHEFRTPLASILMVSDTLISYQYKMDQVQIADRLSKIKDHVLHLTNIVNDVLNLSKLQEGKIGFNPVVEDLVAMCQNIIAGISVSVIQGQINFITPYRSLKIPIDNRLMIQCISNLISNAIKYSEKDIQVEVELKLFQSELIISISDHGIGIPEKDHKHLFTPFFRAGNASTIQGNGLGLSIVNESIQMHGGKVTFVSIPNQGSIFTLHIPADLIYSFELEDEI
jgi:PAS domain S-box-containing protein